MSLVFLTLCAATALQNQDFQLVSQGTHGFEANSFSLDPSISADGRFTCFTTAATNLILTDINYARDVFLYEYDRDQNRLISRGLNGLPASGNSHSAKISADGQTVVFVSEANNLVPWDRNQVADLFLYDVGQDKVERLTPLNGEANGASSQPCLSANGRYIAFTSEASNWVTGDQNQTSDVFVYDRVLQTTQCLSQNELGLSANGANRFPSRWRLQSAQPIRRRQLVSIPFDRQ